MSIEFQGKTYLVGPATGYTTTPPGYDDAGRVQYMNQSCPVLVPGVHTKGPLLLHYQHVNSQWPTFYPLRTERQLLEGWN